MLDAGRVDFKRRLQGLLRRVQVLLLGDVIFCDDKGTLLQLAARVGPLNEERRSDGDYFLFAGRPASAHLDLGVRTIQTRLSTATSAKTSRLVMTMAQIKVMHSVCVELTLIRLV